MRTALSVLVISFALAAGVPSAHAASNHPIPVVATYFSNLAPKVGQHETVTAQFYMLNQRSKHSQYVSGAHLIVSLQVGKKVVMTVKGNSTNKKGKASASFVVPKQASGKWMSAFTKVSYKGTTYGGSNRVKVAKA